MVKIWYDPSYVKAVEDIIKKKESDIPALRKQLKILSRFHQERQINPCLAESSMSGHIEAAYNMERQKVTYRRSLEIQTCDILLLISIKN